MMGIGVERYQGVGFFENDLMVISTTPHFFILRDESSDQSRRRVKSYVTDLIFTL